MRVLCIGSRGSDLSEEVIRNTGNTPNTIFPVIVGVEYTVRGILLGTNGRLNVMVLGGHGWPTWFPIELFVVVDGELPSGWEFTEIDSGGGSVRALWGYPTLIRDTRHLDDLSDRKKPAREAFLRESGVSGWDEETRRFIE